MDKNFLITLTGKSGSGKSTIERMLVNNYGLKRAVSHTSREPRMAENNGIDYYFVGEEIMFRMYEEGKLAEFIGYNGNLYGVSIKELMDSQVIVIEPTGLKQVKEKMKDKKKIISIFLDISEEAMYDRMKYRGDLEANILERIEHDRHHFNVDVDEFDYVIKVDNLTPSQIYDLIIHILNNEGSKQLSMFDNEEGVENKNE